MSLILHSHPFAAFCQKVMVALHENTTPFEERLVDLGDPAVREAFLKISPFGKMPVLEDGARLVNETSIIIEYLDRHYRGASPMLPEDPEAALSVRYWDRFYDLYVADPMQRIVADRRRPPGGADPIGVETAYGILRTAYDVIEKEMATKTWATGKTFTMADCAAAPALFYAEWVEPFGDQRPNLTAYQARLHARPSFAKVIENARPFRHFFPQPRTEG